MLMSSFATGIRNTALALTWIAVQEATTYAEHVIDVGRRTPVERLSHFLLELHARLRAVGRAEKARFTLPFSQEVIADVLGLSVPHLNRMMQQLRKEKLIADSDRVIEFLDTDAMQTLAHYQPQALMPICRGRSRRNAGSACAAASGWGDRRRSPRHSTSPSLPADRSPR